MFSPSSIKQINPIQNYPHIIESYAYVLNIFDRIIFVSDNFFKFLWNMFNAKNPKISNIIIQCIKSYLMSSNIRIKI